jgi:hypothetical protein
MEVDCTTDTFQLYGQVIDSDLVVQCIKIAMHRKFSIKLWSSDTQLSFRPVPEKEAEVKESLLTLQALANE